MRIKKHIEVIANLAFWALLLTVFISLTVQVLPVSKAVGLSLIIVLLLSGTAYFNALFIIPRYFKKGKFGQYFLMIFGSLILVTIVFSISARLLLFEIFQNAPPWHSEKSLPGRIGMSGFRAVPFFFLTIVTLFISSIYKLAKEFLKKERRNTALEKEKIRHELNFLRSQINPHFLFNALNNLHAVVQLNPEKAGDYILKLGDMLRYVLEDCKKNKVSLADEIQYTENYIFFQKQKDADFRNIQFKVNGDDPMNFYLEPMLFIALVENAFEHSYSENMENRYIDIRMELKNGILKFNTQNNISDDEKPPPISERNRSALGLQNIKRRLELLYPFSHSLKHGKRGDFYFAELIIDGRTS